MNPTKGIYILNSNGVMVEENLVRRFTPSIGSGIEVKNNLWSLIRCNSSIGMDPDVMSAQNQAYSISNSRNHVKENYSNLTHNGFAIHDNCTDIAFYRNQMGQHQNIGPTTQPNGALYIGSSAVIGTQQDRFNLFLNGNYAYRVPGLNSAFNVFLVDPPQMAANPDLYPLHEPGIPMPDCDIDPFFICEPNPSVEPPIENPCGINTTGSSVLKVQMVNIQTVNSFSPNNFL